MPKRPRPRRVLGVDFSGANDAGRKIWIAELRRGPGNSLTLVDLRPASELLGGGVDPTTAIAALAAHIVSEPDTIAGCDFPFSLPKSLIDEATWKAFALGFPSRFTDPDAFRHWAMHRAGGREIRRACDRDAKTPFNSYNLRIYRQTWWGIAHLLSPLVGSGRAIVRPYQPLPAKPHPIIIEACPACAMKGIGFYPPYKGRTEKHRLERRASLRKLIDLGLIEPPAPAIRERVTDNTGGDALDAVIAAIATAHAEIETALRPDQRIEGAIYAKFGI
jgi:hypothetical protein